MADRAKKILLVDDEERFLNSIAERLSLLGFEPLKASCGLEALELAKNTPIDLAIVDLKMPDMDGLVTITKLKEIHPALKSVLLTGYGDEKIREATEALNAAYFEKDQMGRFWEFLKNINKSGGTIVIRPPSSSAAADSGAGVREEGLPPAEIEVMSDYKPMEHVPASTAGRGEEKMALPGERLRMIGETRAMRDLRKNIDRLAALDCPVIIRGETGAGKELTSRIIHNLSPRKHNRFMAINCGCFSNDLLIEELFRPGHAAASGIPQESPRFAEFESHGTILLDQIEDLSPKMQLSMLKIIDSRQISLRDGDGDLPFDVRILAASRHNLGKLAKEGRFREELYYRLNVFELFIPPLRERRDDIQPLCRYFLNKYSTEFNKRVELISDEVASLFLAYDFPGNVRELEHILERAVILAEGNSIDTKHLPARFLRGESPSGTAAGKFVTLAEMEKRYILEVLEATGGKKSRAVELLGISRAALWRKLKKFREEE